MSKVYLVLVDRGHAGLKKDQKANPDATPGKETPFIKSLGRRIQEEEFNEPVKNLLRTELERCNIHVVDVSGGERDTPLKERTDYANKIYWQYCSKYGTANVVAIYISIHFNAFDGTFDGRNPSGFSVHIYPGSETGKKLGQAILDELKNGTKQINRGLVEQDLHIVRETAMPAALSENGFMDHPEEAALMLDKDFQQEVAVEHAKGICKYFGIPYKSVNTTISTDKGDEEMLPKAIVVNAFGDTFAAEPLAKRLQCPVFFRETAEKIQVAKQIFVCGGSKDGLKGSNFIVLTGPDRWEAAKAIGDYTKKI
jgi:N-acetylmuramoyl-L-alanine amidase